MGGLCRGRGEWVMQGGVGYLGAGLGWLCRDGVDHTGVRWAVKNFTE